MILSEIFIIYLAAAAPFGVARFFSERSGGAGTGAALLKSAGAALAWPFTSLPRLLRRATSRREDGGETLGGFAPDEQRVEWVKRAAVNSLRALEDLLADARALEGEAERNAFFAAREGVERYAGLALACASASADARPSAREVELCRIAGRGGDDLLVAGRCVHRRNVTRLFAHRERAGAELIKALAAVRELARRARVTSLGERLRPGDVAPISEALLLALSRAAELIALFDERPLVDAAACLLEEESARLGHAESPDGAKEGEEPCTTQAVHTAFATRPLKTTTSPNA